MSELEREKQAAFAFGAGVAIGLTPGLVIMFVAVCMLWVR